MAAALRLTALALLAAAGARALERITIDAERNFRDEAGRVRVFHGINDVAKSEPYLSAFTDEQLREMSEDWGYNLLRLGFSWEGYERQRGVKDANYTAQTSAMVDRLAGVGIYTLVDSHQDLYSRVYCGNGFPEWAIRISPEAEAVAPFPIPVLGRGVVYEPDPVTGWIRWEDCARSYWGTYYFSVVTGSMFANFYANEDGIQESYADMWRDIATAFTGRPEVLGYDIINEPFPGNIFRNPRLLLNASYADETLLQPLYERAHAAIREVDDQTFIFFEPLVSNSEILPRKSGLQTPGGPAYRNRGVYSFHFYCLHSNDRPQYCPEFLDISFEQREEDAARMGVPKMLTEFGHLYGTSEDKLRNNTEILDRADQDWMSWTNWAYARMEDPLVELSLVRPYARAIAGVPVSTVYDYDAKRLQLAFRIDRAIAAPTEVFLPIKLVYPGGANATAVPAGSVVFSRPQAHLLWIEPSASAQTGDLVTVTVGPA